MVNCKYLLYILIGGSYNLLYCGGKVKVSYVILRYFDVHNDNKYSCTVPW